MLLRAIFNSWMNCMVGFAHSNLKEYFFFSSIRLTTLHSDVLTRNIWLQAGYFASFSTVDLRRWTRQCSMRKRLLGFGVRCQEWREPKWCWKQLVLLRYHWGNLSYRSILLSLLLVTNNSMMLDDAKLSWLLTASKRRDFGVRSGEQWEIHHRGPSRCGLCPSVYWILCRTCQLFGRLVLHIIFKAKEEKRQVLCQCFCVGWGCSAKHF